MISDEKFNDKVLTPQEVRAILKVDNKDIVDLCKKASIKPKKNAQGHTYFSYEEVKNLRKIQNANMMNPIVSSRPTSVITASRNSDVALSSVLNSIQNMETKLENKIAKVIDEKLEGMDDVVVELIRCKTDNESLKQKIVDLNKELYQLKNELNSYKSVGFGFYKKKEVYVWE